MIQKKQLTGLALRKFYSEEFQADLEEEDDDSQVQIE